MTDFATLVLAADSRSLVSGEKALDSLASTSVKAETTVNKAMADIERSTGVAGKGLADLADSARKSAESFIYLEKLESQIDSLAMSIDPVYAASKRYEAALLQLNEAANSGVISQARYNTLLEQAERAYLKVPAPLGQIANATEQVGTQSIFAGHQSRMMAMQLSQVAQQASATGNWVQALAIQLPDMALGLGTVGIGAGVVAGALLPMIANMVMAGDEAVDLEDTMNELAGAMNDYESAAKDALTPAHDLIDTFGIQASAAAEVYDVLLKIKELEFAGQLQAAQDALADSLGKITESVRAYDEATSVAMQDHASGVRMMQTEIQALANEYGITAGQARRISDALDDLASANGPAEAARASKELGDAIERAADEGAKIPPALRDAQKEAYQTYLAAAKFDNSIASAEGGANGLASALGAAAGNAGALARAMASLPALDPLRGFNSNPGDILQPDAGSYDFGGAGTRGDPRQFEKDSYYSGRYFPSPAELMRQTKARSGGGSSRSKPSNGFTDDMREAERIFNETRTAAEKYQAELDDLNELHQMGYLDADTYSRAIKKVGEEYEQTSEAAKFFADAAYQGFMDMIPAIETGNKALDNLLNTLIQTVAQAALLGKGPLAQLFGTAVGGGVRSGGLFGGLFGGFFADGGTLGAGKWGIAGEAGPEIIHGPATITPMGQAGGAQIVDVRVTGVFVDDNGVITARINQSSQQARQQAVSDTKSNFSTWANQTQTYGRPA